MKRFCIKIVLFTLFIVAIDRPFILFKYRIINVFSEISSKKMIHMRKYLDSSKITAADVAIYGASHAQFGIAPEVIQANTGMSCLNFAYGGGTNIASQLEFIKKLNIHSKAIVFAIDVYCVREKGAKSDLFQQTFFSKGDSILNERDQNGTEFNMENLSMDVLKYSNIYMYSHFISDYLKDIRKGNYTLPYLRPQGTYNLSFFSQYNGYEITNSGWVKGHGYANVKTYRYPWWVFEVNKESETALAEMADYCAKKGMQLILVQIPEHKLALSYKQKYIEFEKWMTTFVSQHPVTYLNFNSESLFPANNDSLFYDTDHLNEAGARIFSAQLATQLQHYVK